MSSEAASATIASTSKPTVKVGGSQNVAEEIKKRRSQELVLGICGAIGSGAADLDVALQRALKANGYKVETIKISDLIIRIKADTGLYGLSGFEKYSRYQASGNEIRKEMGFARLSEEAILEIVNRRGKIVAAGQPPGTAPKSDSHKNTEKVAYIINQLKHPSEVALLQTIYKQNFYLVGLLRTEKERKHSLEQAGITSANADDLIHIDKKDAEKNGQQVEKTLHMADFFFRNKGSSVNLKDDAERFIRLIHGFNGVTPTRHEVGMYEAFSASLRSACLSRQVGAAVMNKKGDVLSTGCNDVPVFGGGLYNTEHKEDRRCVFKGGECYNDLYKRRLESEFKKILSNQFEDLASTPETENIKSQLLKDAGKIAGSLLNDTRAKSLIEYSRAVHAEMDALLQLARTEGQSTVGTILYCTTYPCHSCARHIVAAGVSKVIYIEPYEKSLAIALHDDAISDSGESGKVSFEPFEGVAPRRYSKFFQAQTRKDDVTGKAIFNLPSDSHHIDPQYLDSYFDYEDKVVQKLKTG